MFSLNLKAVIVSKYTCMNIKMRDYHNWLLLCHKDVCSLKVTYLSATQNSSHNGSQQSGVLESRQSYLIIPGIYPLMPLHTKLVISC